MGYFKVFFNHKLIFFLTANLFSLSLSSSTQFFTYNDATWNLLGDLVPNHHMFLCHSECK